MNFGGSIKGALGPTRVKSQCFESVGWEIMFPIEFRF